MTKSLKELGNLSDKGIYKRDKVEWWLMKYEDKHQTLLRFFDELKSIVKSPRSLTKYANQSQFLDMYEVLLKVTEFYRNEDYFKEQIGIYNLVKNDLGQLESWLEIHKTDKKHKYREFVSLFQDNSTISNYNLTILYPLSLPVKVKLDELDFYHVLRFLEILEKSNKIQINGAIEIINELEDVKLNKHQIYRRQTLIVSVKDIHQSKLPIRFLKGKTELLTNLKVGQKVKVYADLLGGKDESNKQGYSLSLLGWSIEELKK
ncbi:DUF3127 domain-containing protein [Tenacibaculum aquimarinum]|uniref:DUF3127 domain-containing protein n=1 Tax=Tenacibaculum aquimarinum TaxID=2910675 RepID=UPI001F0AFF19|nr:DUF3127 domain-containing protein [Tenacibaculum aquimarinum]MCH3883498.1 DUF3127 domain-containing protein [Tenacibaculum aquimarinum]